LIKSILAKFTSQGKIVILIVDQINSADNDEFRILMELIRSFFPWTLIIFIESANNYIDQNVEKSLRLFTRHLCDFFISTIKWEEMKTEINKKIDINSFLILINDGKEYFNLHKNMEKKIFLGKILKIFWIKNKF